MRLRNDLKDIIKSKYTVFLDKTVIDRDIIYTILLNMNEKGMPYHVTRSHIIPFLEKQLMIEDLSRKPIPREFTIKEMINNKQWNIRFSIPPRFPFKAPDFTINTISGSNLKNIGNKNLDIIEPKKYHLLIDLYTNFEPERWSPAFRLHECIEYIKMAIRMHYDLPEKSGFLELIDKI